MAPLVWDGIVRFSIIQSYGGREVVNLWDQDLTTSVGTTREEACFEQAGDILNNWDDHIRTAQVSELTCVSVDWVDLNSATGSTGSRSVTSANTWPAAGGATGPGFPPNVSALITKVTPGGGRATRNGRLYLAGLAEAVSTEAAPAEIEAATVTSLNTRWASFLSGVDDAATWGETNSGVLRTQTIGGEVVAVGFNEITSLQTQARLATQRRRLRG